VPGYDGATPVLHQWTATAIGLSARRERKFYYRLTVGGVADNLPIVCPE